MSTYTLPSADALWKIKRDIKKRGYTIKKVLENIELRKKDFNEYILPQKKNADIIINFYKKYLREKDLRKFIYYEKCDFSGNEPQPNPKPN